MSKTKKVVILLIAVLLIMVNPIIGSASENIYYSALPEPVPSNNVKYYLVDAKNSEPYLFIFSVPSIVQDDFVFQLNVNENGSVIMGLFSSFGLGFTLKVLVYDLQGNNISSRNVQISTDTIDFVTLSHYNVRDLESFETFDIAVGDPNNVLTVPRTKVAWSSTTNPITYTEWLNRILTAITDSNNQSQQQTDEIISNQSQNTDEIVSNQNQNTQDIIDNQNQLQENEKNEANSSGNDNANALINALPHYEDGLKNAFNSLTTVLNYTGTDCKWEFPALYMPEIPNVMGRIQLSESQTIDIDEWVYKIPQSLLILIQNLLTAALIIYCIKQFYDVIAEIFVNRKEDID